MGQERDGRSKHKEGLKVRKKVTSIFSSKFLSCFTSFRISALLFFI